MKMNFGRQALAATLVAAGIAFAPAITYAQAAPQQVVPKSERHKVVLQVSDDNPKNWTTAFNVINNLTQTYGRDNVEIELVAFSDGIHSLAFDSKVANRIPGALERGAKVIACENSMKRFKLARGDMSPELGYVEAGVRRIIERQKEGWAVIRP